MSIITIIVLFALIPEFPEVPVDSRASRRAATRRACVRRRNTARAVIGDPYNRGKIRSPYEPDFDVPGRVSFYGRKTKPCRGEVSHKWDTFYFKTRSYIDTGRIHNGDAKRKGKRLYKEEKLDKIRIQQALQDLYS